MWISSKNEGKIPDVDPLKGRRRESGTKLLIGYKNQEEQEMLRIGFLTSGGDCQALNAAMRGVFKCITHNAKEPVEFYGFEDGYTTGRICSWTACFYPIYADSLDLVPDFDRQVLEGNLKGRGRIRLGFFVRLLIWLLLKKEVRFAICYLLKLRKKPRQASKEPKTA